MSVNKACEHSSRSSRCRGSRQGTPTRGIKVRRAESEGLSRSFLRSSYFALRTLIAGSKSWHRGTLHGRAHRFQGGEQFAGLIEQFAVLAASEPAMALGEIGLQLLVVHASDVEVSQCRALGAGQIAD